jgi:hypothetical protein
MTANAHCTLLHLDSRMDLDLEALASALRLSKAETIIHILRRAIDEAASVALQERRRSTLRRRDGRLEL